VLFSNPTIAKLMNEKFVPHWVNVRDVPKVTIDFGKGRVLERTLNGNIATYICLPDGRTLDVITGLNDEATYLRRLQEGLELYRALRAHPLPDSHDRDVANQSAFARCLAHYHEVSLGSGHKAGLAAIRQGPRPEISGGAFVSRTYGGDLAGVARFEEHMAMTKGRVEDPLKRAIAIDPALPQARLPKKVDPYALSPSLNPAELSSNDDLVDSVLGGAVSKGAVERPLKRELVAKGEGPREGGSFLRDPAAKGMVETPLKHELDLSAFSKFKVEAPLKRELGREAPERSERYDPASKKAVEAPLKGALHSRDHLSRDHLSPEEVVLVEKAKPTLDADSRHNETTRRLQIHRLLLLRPLQQPSALAEVVYKEVMHVDISDPFLGLAPMVVGGEIGRRDGPDQP